MSAPGDVAVEAAQAMVGRPYAYGAPAGDTTSFDCSSLVQWAWGLAGVALPRASIDQLQALAPSRIDDLRTGDLVFYDNALPNGPPYRGVNHVVMWMGEGRVVEASSIGGGVRVVALAEKGRPLGVRRPGVEGALPEWRYVVPRAVALAGRWVLERSGHVVGGTGIDRRGAAMSATPSSRGYWVAGADGRIVAFGDAVLHGEAPLAAVAMTATPTGGGYWVAGVDGQVAAFGDARHLGDAEGLVTAMAMAATPTGHGYWVADAFGRVSARGDAQHHGDHLDAVVPVVAMAATTTGGGYWLADAGGRVSAFGDALPLTGRVGTEPVVGMAASEAGCRLLDAAGRVFEFELAGAPA